MTPPRDSMPRTKHQLFKKNAESEESGKERGEEEPGKVSDKPGREKTLRVLKWSRLICRHVSTGHGTWRPLSPVTRHCQPRGDKSRVAKDQEVTGSEEEVRVLCP